MVWILLKSIEMKITRLPRGNAQFPGEKDPGDIVVLSNNDIFVWSKGIWMLLGGRFLKDSVRDWLLDYLKDGWPTPSDAKFDLGYMVELAGENSEDRKWTNMALQNTLKLSETLQTERIS